MENKNVKSKLCFDPRIARKCIQAGCRVCDIKPYRDDPSRTVIVFEVDEFFEKTFAEISEEFKKKDDAKKELAEQAE